MGFFELFKKKTKERKESLEAANPVERPNTVEPSKQAEKKPIESAISVEQPKMTEPAKARAFPSEFEGKKIKYYYDKIDVFTPKEFGICFETLEVGKDILLVKEPENVYDNEAVAVYVEKLKLGYLYRGTRKNMAFDYLTRGWPILGCVDSVDDDEGKCTVALFFYGPKKAAGIFKLTGTGSKAAQESILFLGEEDRLVIEYDDKKEKYAVYSMDERIGYLPKSAEKLAEGNADFVVDHTQFDDNAKTVVYVRAEK